GGGIFTGYDSAGSARTFDFSCGNISYNGAASNGGGIYANSNESVQISGGEVSYNSAKDGGGVWAYDVKVDGGTIAGNTASEYGGGVYTSYEFYLYGSGVIGDASKSEIAQEDDCSNKAAKGGGVYAAGGRAFIGYSDSSTPAECTGGIYCNYATGGTNAAQGDGGGLYLVKNSSYTVAFKMASGTIAYNAVPTGATGRYGGGLAIYGASAGTGETKEITGGSFVENAAAKGGAIFNSIPGGVSVGDAIYIPSDTGEQGDNDVYLYTASTHYLKLASAFTDTHTPVMTITPPSYTLNRKIFEEDDTLLPTNCEKVAIASDGSGAPWTVSNKGLLVKDCAECYVSQTTGVDDTSHDGSVDKPYKSIYYAAKQFSNKTAPLGGTAYKPTFKNIIYVLGDMTFTLGAGADSGEACNYEVVGRAGDVAGSPVTFTFNTDSSSGFYVPATHIAMLKNINITQDQTECSTITYAAIHADGGTLYMEDCSITGIKANNCSAIAADGDGGAGNVYLNNVSIKNNVTNPNVSGGSVWGPAVSVKSGNLYVMGKVEICDNTMQGYGDQNVWIGENSGTPVFHPIVVAGKLATGTSIGVTTYDLGATEFTTGYKSAGNTAEPRTYFASDNEMQVVWNTAVDEAELKLPTTIYVSSTSASPAGNDTTGDGSLTKPYATLQKALNVLDGYNVATNAYTIIVNGQVLGASTIKSGIKATKITIQGKTGASSDKLKGSSSAAVLTISGAIPVDISDLTITGGQRGVNMAAAATVTITDCEITENTGSVSGTGVYVGAGGSITIKDTNITKNTANGSSSSGGGIYVNTSTALAHFEVSGGSISNNTAKEGGAATLHCQSGITPILSGVTISANKATSGNAGAIYVPNG
ncbi:MAG: right-handed parallel beta-helix repeat-containing protein, partial [Treponema sp.]|nr:right-handed parallel beta-helix repeat-containing protein [Treponema sp.]